jgi:cell division transport system ATP-binding protein
MSASVEFREVSVVYPNGTQALSDITLSIGATEFAFLVGPTGHGKSTLLKLLTREEVPSRGKVFVSGWDVGALSPYRVPHLRRRVGMVFQDFRLLPQRTSWENIDFALRVTGLSHRSALRRIPEVLCEVDLLDKADSFPAEMSAGEQQRLAIARALALKPSLLLADEPTGNLDPHSSSQILGLLANINAAGTTVLVATHDPAIVNAAPRRVIALREGRVVSDVIGGSYPDDLGFG